MLQLTESVGVADYLSNFVEKLYMCVEVSMLSLEVSLCNQTTLYVPSISSTLMYARKILFFLGMVHDPGFMFSSHVVLFL